MLRSVFSLLTPLYQNFDTASHRSLSRNAVKARLHAGYVLETSAPSTGTVWDLLSVPRGHHKLISVDGENLLRWGQKETGTGQGRIHYSVAEPMFSRKAIVHMAIYKEGTLDDVTYGRHGGVLHMWAKQTADDLTISKARFMKPRLEQMDNGEMLMRYDVEWMPKKLTALQSTLLCASDMHDQIVDNDIILWDATMDKYRTLPAQEVSCEFEKRFRSFIL